MTDRDRGKSGSVAKTLCPACTQPVEHPSDYVVAVVHTATVDGVRTKLVANDTIVLHACTTPPDD